MATEFADRPARFIAEMVAGEFVSVASMHAVDEAAATIEAYARARESRVRAAVIADLRGLVDRAYPSSHLYGSSLVVDAESVESLIIELESQL